ncbi:MAG: hypothetical protein OXG56_10910 [Gammaproteobacteria bacterium]|nr:hypothetical protein [Gammaproteobacteria bacterium]
MREADARIVREPDIDDFQETGFLSISRLKFVPGAIIDRKVKSPNISNSRQEMILVKSRQSKVPDFRWEEFSGRQEPILQGAAEKSRVPDVR